MNKGWYYLHTNGLLIFKCDYTAAVFDMRDSNFVLMFWPMDVQDRSSAWRLLIEAGAIEATNKDRLNELADKWNCDDSDAQHYADRVDVVLFMDGNQWCAVRQDFTDLQESPAGFGDTAREAMSELCKNLEYKISKLWGDEFASLVAVKKIEN